MIATPACAGYYWMRVREDADWQIVELAATASIRWFRAGVQSLDDFEKEYPDAQWSARLKDPAMPASPRRSTTIDEADVVKFLFEECGAIDWNGGSSICRVRTYGDAEWHVGIGLLGAVQAVRESQQQAREMNDPEFIKRAQFDCHKPLNMPADRTERIKRAFKEP